MKTLVNKANPAIRITAPEIEDAAVYGVNCRTLHSTQLCLFKDDWTLVEEESKHTEVWVEGRTIFEQDAKKPEMDLEKAVEEYIEKRASLAPNESWDIEDMRDAVRFGAEWQKQRDKEWMEAKEKEFKDIRDTTRWVNRDLGYNDGFDAGVDRAFKQFSDILDRWEAHAIEGMKVGASAYHQGKISLICDLRDWIKEQTKKTITL